MEGGERAAPMDAGPAIFLSAVSVTNKQTSLFGDLSSFLHFYLLSSSLLSVLTLTQHHSSLCTSETFLSVIFSPPVYILLFSPSTQNFLLAVENLALGKPATPSLLNNADVVLMISWLILTSGHTIVEKYNHKDRRAL